MNLDAKYLRKGVYVNRSFGFGLAACTEHFQVEAGSLVVAITRSFPSQEFKPLTKSQIPEATPSRWALWWGLMIGGIALKAAPDPHCTSWEVVTHV